MRNDHHQQHRGGKQKPARVSERASGDSGDSDARRAKRDIAAFDGEHYRAVYRDASYYSSGRDWRDYEPAYRYGHDARAAHRGQRFEDVEAELAGNWNRMKSDSRLLWVEAYGAVLDAWRRFGDTVPGVVGGRRRDD